MVMVFSKNASINADKDRVGNVPAIHGVFLKTLLKFKFTSVSAKTVLKP